MEADSPYEKEQELHSQEAELLAQAKALEAKMEQLKTQKVNVVVDQFEHQLIKEAAQEEKRYNERLQTDHETKLQQLAAEKSTALKDIG